MRFFDAISQPGRDFYTPSSINPFGGGGVNIDPNQVRTPSVGGGAGGGDWNPMNPFAGFGGMGGGGGGAPPIFNPLADPRKNPITNPEGAKKQFGDIWDQITGMLGETRKDIYGQNPRIDPDKILPPGGTGGITSPTYNPYEAQAKALAEGNIGPDFTAANVTAGQQNKLAQALAGLYGTGSGAVTGLIGNLQQQAKGNFGPGGSLAQAMLNQGLSQNIAGVRSQLASQRGLSPALAARYAAQQTAQLGGQTSQQAGILGLQQQLAAQQQLGQLGMGAAELGGGVGGQLLTKGREADIAQATAKSDADLKKLNILASSDVGLKQIAAQTGLGEAELKAKIEMANQAAATGDRDRMFDILGGILSAVAGAASTAAMAYSGGRINGKAPHSGDHPKNDIVPAMLSPGEIVIPRSAAKDKAKAKAFLDALDGWEDKPSYSKVLKARRARK